MRGSGKINYRPYLPLNRIRETVCSYIGRLAPGETGVELEWLDNGSDGHHTLFYGKRGEKEKTALSVADSVVRIDGLEKETEYEFYMGMKKAHI